MALERSQENQSPEQAQTLELARAMVAEIEANAQSFAANPSPATYHNFAVPFADPSYLEAVNTIKQAADLAKIRWQTNLLHDRSLQHPLLKIGPSDVEQLIEESQKNIRSLGTNPVAKLRNVRAIRNLQGQVTKLNGYSDNYQTSVAPLIAVSSELTDRVTAAVNGAAQNLRGIFQEQSQRPSIETTINNEAALAEIEDLWLDLKVTKPLAAMANTFVRQQRVKSADYSTIDEAIDRGNLRNLTDEYIDAIKREINQDPKTRKEWQEIARQRRESRDEEFRNFESEFRELGLEHEFWNISHSRTETYGSERINTFGWGPGHDEEVIDIRPMQAFLEWARLFDSIPKGDDQAWQLPELRQAQRDRNHPNANYLKTLVEASEPAARKSAPVDLLDTDANKLNEIPSFDRWLPLRKFLEDNNLADTQTLDKFEQTLVDRLVFEILIPDGRESWPGTGVCQNLKSMGSPRALEPLLYYQTLVSGPSGLYAAGHTNAQAQAALEFILANAQETEIDNLKIPLFAKDALRVLKYLPIDNNPYGDYIRSSRTAGLVGSKFREAIGQIRENSQNPDYQRWIVALLHGMKNSTQPFSEETYGAALELLDLDPSPELQNEVLQMIASRVHNEGPLGINTRINPDFPIAIDALFSILNRSDFEKSATNFGAIYHLMEELQQAVEFSKYSDAELAQMRINGTMLFGMPIGVESRDQMETSLKSRDALIDLFNYWMHDPNTPGEARYMILQIFDLTGFDYQKTTNDIANLLANKELGKQADDERFLTNLGYIKMNFAGEVNSHGYVKCLTNLLVRRYMKFSDQEAADLVINTFVKNPATREKMTEYFADWNINKYIDQDSQKIHELFDQFNQILLNSEDDVAEAVIKLFNEGILYRIDTYRRDLILKDIDVVTGSKKSMLFDSLMIMVWNNEHFVGKEIPQDLVKSGNDQYYRFGQETVALIAEKMWDYLDSADISQQLWAVYTLNLYGHSGDKFQEVVKRLLEHRTELERQHPNASQFLDRISERFNF